MKLDATAYGRKVGAACVPGIGWKQRTVNGNNLMGEESQKIRDLDKYLENLLAALFSQPPFEVCKGCFARDVGVAKP